MQEIQKPAYNEEYRTCQFRRPDGRGQLNNDELITAGEVVCIDPNGQDVSAVMISEVAPYDQTQVRYFLKGGVRGDMFFLHVRGTTSNGQKLEETFKLRIT